MTNETIRRFAGASAIFLVATILGGCAATETLLSKKDLVVQAKTTTAIFVDPVPRAKRTIYLDVKSGVDGFDRRAFKSFVSEQFAASENGYRLTDDPRAAQFTMVAYVLNLQEARPTAVQQAIGHGYGGEAVDGAQLAGSILSDSNGAIAGAGLAAGAAEHIAGNLVHDVTFMLVCDVQIRERAAPRVVVHKDTEIDVKVSDRGSTKHKASETTDRKEYRTRIVATANKANLDLEDAKPQLFKKTAQAMAGFF
jgi:hypothetical protein